MWAKLAFALWPAVSVMQLTEAAPPVLPEAWPIAKEPKKEALPPACAIYENGKLVGYRLNCGGK